MGFLECNATFSLAAWRKAPAGVPGNFWTFLEIPEIPGNSGYFRKFLEVPEFLEIPLGLLGLP